MAYENLRFCLILFKCKYIYYTFIKRQDQKAYSPCFPKPKDEGWIMVLGDVEKRELVALKRVGYVRGHTDTQLAFYTPESTGI